MIDPRFMEAVAFIYPNAKLGTRGDVQIVNDGSGPVIARWGIAGPIPTDQEVTDALAVLDTQGRGVDLVTLKIAFNHENRIRVLESKAPLTLAQFKVALKAVLT